MSESPVVTPAAAEAPRPWYLAATPLATLPWLVRLRATTVAVDLAAIVVGAAFTRLDFPLRRLAWFIAAAAVVHGLRTVALARRHSTPRLLDLLGLVTDAALLTLLLEMTGGPFNPFVAVFLLQIGLAALTLGPSATAVATLTAGAGFALLIYWHTHEPDPVHHRLNDLPTHLFTMWMAFTVTTELIAYFILQASTALARREQELEQMRQQAARTERVMAMTTLAAGAAHELSTPLGTIALASRELERSAVSNRADAGLIDDARLIRAEVDRCRAILDQMSGRAGGATADDPEAVEIATIIADVRQRLGEPAAQRVDVQIDPAVRLIYLPRAGFTQALLSLIKNATDATAGDPQSTVRVEVQEHLGRLLIRVRDHGPGIAPPVLTRAGEPFFTTKEAGRGLGLGLFLTRIFAERIGGTLSLDSRHGTTATLDLPLRAEVSS